MLPCVIAATGYGASSLLMRQPPPVVTAQWRAPPPMMADAPAENLKCDVRKLKNSAVALDIKVPKHVADEIHLKTLAKLAKNAKVPGFRDGKVPPQAVIAKLGMQKVKEATVEQIVDVGLSHSGVGERIQTVGDARLPEELEGVAERYTVGEALDFTIEVDVMPEAPIEESAYKGLSVEVEKEELNMEAYEASMLKLRKQFADIIDQPDGVGAEEGNQLVVNMNGFLATPEGGKGEELPQVAGGDGITVPLEAGKFMPGLVEGLVGVTNGEKRDITVTFPPRSSAPQLAGKTAIFEVECLAVQRRELPELSDEFAARVTAKTNPMDMKGLEAKLQEGVQADADEKMKSKTLQAFEKALVQALPEDFDVPETLVENVSKERFAMMLGDMRERGTTDEELKKLVTPENYENYKKISRTQVTNSIKGNFAIQAVGAQQGLTVAQDEVDDEVMTQQAQAVQRGEKFKESEVRGRIEQQLERTMVLSWLQSQGTVTVVDAKEFDPAAELGASPEQLAAELAAEKKAEGTQAANEKPTATAEAKPTAKPAAKPAAEAVGDANPAEEAAATEATSAAPNGFEWGQTF